MPIRPRPHLAWLRRALLAVLLLLVLGLGALFWFGRAGQRPDRSPASEEVSRTGGEVTLIGDDFDYTLTEEERPIFRIRGESIRADRQDTLYLDGVALTVYDKQGRAYHVESKEASFSRVRNEGRLRGNVRLRGPSGLTLRAGVLQLREKGQVLISPRPVWIGFADAYLGRAQRMRVQIPEEIFILEGNVEVHSIDGTVPPVSMKAERMVYERGERLLRIEDKVQLDRGPEHVQAQKINGQLTADERSLSFLHALGGVSGRTRREGGDPAATVVRFAGEDLTVQFDPSAAPAQAAAPGQPDLAAEVRKVELDGKGGRRVSIETAGAGTTRTLTAARIETRMAGGALSGAQAFGGVEVRETSPAGNRRLTGQRADAGFGADGQLARVAVDQKVVFTSPDLRATGDKGNMDLVTGKGEFQGNPAEAQSDRGKLNAPRLTYDQATQLLQATGGVRAVLEQVDSSAVAGTLGPGEGPVRVQSQDAFWRQAPQGFLFRGDVRAWRGESVLLTQELRADQSAPKASGQKPQNVLNASGGVKSLWIPADEPAKGKQKTQPIEVTGNGMVYRETEGLVVYSGDVRVEQTGRVLRCDELQVELGEDRKAETMTCTGNTRLDDPQGGRSITAERAIYELDRREVEMFGDPVVMKDRGKNQVRGKRLVYHIDDGRVEVKGQAPAGVASGGAPGGV
jgi:lipopolysaccharide transport protein LptA/LPS export ABC transporter protein LptC